jgi:UDP-N-acetylglucosamine 2-epimerase
MMIDTGGVTVIEPVEYTAMLSLTKDADCVLTDSGGLVKEAFLLKTPCVTVRTTTEWPETLEAGANILVNAAPEAIAQAVNKMSTVSVNPVAMPFGDGTAAKKIAVFIKKIAAS